MGWIVRGDGVGRGWEWLLGGGGMGREWGWVGEGGERGGLGWEWGFESNILTGALQL